MTKQIIVGDDNANVLNGGAGNDFIAGLGGNDVISGGAGIDKIAGGADNGSFDNAATGLVDFSDVGDLLYGGTGVDFFKYNAKGSLTDGADLIVDFENDVDKLILHGQYTIQDTSIFLDSDDPIFEGEVQNIEETEFGFEIVDAAYVNFGNGKGIVVKGVSAADIANDIIDITPADQNTINGTEGNDNLTGTANNDTINGFGGRDIITGGNGNDTINGGNGKDFLAGQKGNDVINGGAGFDTITGGADTGTVVIDEGNVASLSGGGDILTGGANLDVFKYKAKGVANDGADLITDFTTGVDKLSLQGAYALVDVANGTFVKFAEGAGIIVENVASVDLAADILVA